MLNHRSVGARTVLLLWKLAGVTASFWGWLFLWHSAVFDDPVALQRYLLYNEFLLVGIIFAGSAKKPDQGQPTQPFVQANRDSLRQAFLGLFSVFVVNFALADMLASRSFFFSYVPWLYLTLLFANLLLPSTLAKWAFSGNRVERVALAGTVEQARLFGPWLERKSLIGLQTVGLVCPEAGPSSLSPFPVLGALDQIGEILKQRSITQLIVLDISLGSHWLKKLTQLCEGAAVRLLVVHDLNSYFSHTTTMIEDDGVRFVALREEPLESPLNRFLKRTLDLLVAVPVVACVLPVMTVLVWALHRMQSPGPVFFTQVRNGMMGRPFRMVKFRTMHPNNQNEAQQASKNDSRVFPAGSWLRRLSLDELPQFINVLTGDMSVVGPRPHLPKHEEMFIRVMRRYVIRQFIRPGLTGWAQVNGFRGEIHTEADIEQRVEADIHYLETWSFSLDCLIILRTFKHCVFPPRNAY
jgi:exopolysaccharide biosynthesis polyprenyl glycosylphosphotransferase